MKVFKYLLLFVASLGILSCQQEDMSINKNDKYGVTVNDARKLADLASQISISGSKQASGNNRELKERQIKEVLAYPNANTPAL